MQKMSITLTVFFAEPFWVGVLERQESNKLKVSKITFGAEPKDPEILSFLLNHWSSFVFSPPVSVADTSLARPNPKRMQRSIKKQTEARGLGTKSQQALKLQQEAKKSGRKEQAREKKEEDQKRRYEQRQQKRKEKHRGK